MEPLCQFIRFGEEDTDVWSTPFTPSEERACGQPAKFMWYYSCCCEIDGKHEADCREAEQEYWVCADHWDQLVTKLESYQLKSST